MDAAEMLKPLSTKERTELQRLRTAWACATATRKQIERCMQLAARDRAAKATGSAA